MKTVTVPKGHDNFTWEEVPYRMLGSHLTDKSVQASWGYPNEKEAKEKKKKPLLRIRFGKEILAKLGAKPTDRLLLLQAKENVYNYLLVKAANGYNITSQETARGFTIAFRFDREGLQHFPMTECEYHPKNGAIRIVFPEIRFNSK